ncbi:MAG: sugar phosphate isomerase/epimerase family protein [Acidobacteriota bacterium]
MTNWPVGLSTGCFYRTSIFEVLAPVRESGFSLLEISSSPGHFDFRNPEELKRLARLLPELDLLPFSFHAPLAEHLDITSADEGQRQRAVHEMLGVVEAAAGLRAGHLIVHPGPDHLDRTDGEQHRGRLKRAGDSLRTIQERCRQLDVMMVVENMLPHLSLGPTTDLLGVIAQLDGDQLGVCLDTGHANLAGDIYDLPRQIGNRLRMLHVHDNHGGRDDHLPPGQGQINWQLLMGRLAEQNFNGPLILELAGDSSQPNQVLREARAGREMLERIEKRLGG